MEKNFNSKDASALISFHRELIRELLSIVSANNDLKNEYISAAAKLISKGTFDGEVSGFLSERADAPVSSAAEKFCSLMYRYHSTVPAAERAEEILDLRRSIEPLIEVLKPAGNGLRWLFTSSKSKELAIGAYERLSQLRESSYPDEVRQLTEAFNAVISAAPGAAQEAVGNNRQYYRRCLHNDLPEARTHEPPRPVRRTTEPYLSLSDMMKRADERFDESRRDVEDSAKRMLMRTVFSIMDDIPVEEVNRQSSGIRVKTLRDAGYTTVADIYAASPVQLAAINGISEQRAEELKSISARFAQDAFKGAKLRLSADDKSGEASELIAAVSTYRHIRSEVSELDTQTSGQYKRVRSALNTLGGLGSSLNWLFFSDDEKLRFADAHSYLKSIRDSGFISKAGGLAGRVVSVRKTDASSARAEFEADPIGFINTLEEIVPGMLGNDDTLYGLPEDLAKEIQDQDFFPDGLLCTPRNYQVWGIKYILHQERVLLGDEMGLGKTVQAIASMVSLRNTGETHFIVICPASVLANWCREISRHSRLRPVKIHGSSRTAAVRDWKQRGGVAVTTYETTSGFALEDEFSCGMIVVDEAHYIKNPGAKRTQNVKKLCAHSKRLLFMTGTALENRVDEMISLIDVLRPKLAAEIKAIAHLSSAPQFRERIASVYYRRKREDVLTELPEKIESSEWVTMTPKETEIYEHNALTRNFMSMRRVSWDVEDLKDSSKAERLKELVEEAEQEDRKVLVFSFFRETVSRVCWMFPGKVFGPITGSISPQQRQEIIDSFDAARGSAVLAAQIQAGGTGLNIQAASVVIICEPQIKPSIENQAISRAYRMGQARNVLVYRLLCDDSVDERMLELLKQKQDEFDAFADKSVAADESIELDNASFNKIINEEIERIRSKPH